MGRGRISRSHGFRKVNRWMKTTAVTGTAILFILFLFALPDPLFNRSHSTVLYSSEGELLNAVTADDGQWRFPARTKVPDKFSTALIQFEDQHFREHNGVYLPSILSAVRENLSRGRVVRGGSTLSMQVIRMSRDNPKRTWSEKVLEMALAMRLEWRYNKEDIIALYASHAPFGGNVVGLDAAAWRYFGHPAEELSWAESATLAVLPNAPSLIFPGRNQDKLLLRRNALLKRLHEAGYIDSETLELSYLEPLPGKPYPLPQIAPHLMNTLCRQNGYGKIHRTTVRYSLQESAVQAVAHHISQFEPSHVHNAAAIVIEVSTGEVMAYVGNASGTSPNQGQMVDVIPARRSSGSILKPFLYAAMIQDGQIMPHSLVPDIPIQFDGFAPRNYSLTFDGAVPASQALSRSLNVPSVIMLKDFGYARFHHRLKKLGFTHIDKPASHYGLSLILGGAEASLWDVAKAYAGMARTLNQFNRGEGYLSGTYSRQTALADVSRQFASNGKSTLYPPLTASAIYTTLESLLKVNRPETEIGWEAYHSSGPVAWKTGTSFGNRDAWAAGVTPEYVVAVWVGNADGTGRPELTGVNAAAPLLFDLFSRLPAHSWFAPPVPEMARATVCRESGMLALDHCPETDTLLVPTSCAASLPCSYHTLLHLNPEGTHQVTSDCMPPDMIRAESWFILPGVQEYYYMKNHPGYRLEPPYMEGCATHDASPVSWIYPKSDSPIIIPRNLTGENERTVLKASHRDPQATLYWHLNEEYLGATRMIHEMEIVPEPGEYFVTIVDHNGNTISRKLKIIRSN